MKEASMDIDWVIFIQYELHQFARSNVWYLVQDLLTEPLLGPGGCSETSWMRMKTIKILIAFATFIGLKLFQVDVKSAFLNGDLKEAVYVKQPPGVEVANFPNHVFKLNKDVYGLK